MGIVFLISIFTVFYVYCMLLCLLHCAGLLCVFDSQLECKVQKIYFENIPFIPIPSILLAHSHDSRYIQIKNVLQKTFKPLKWDLQVSFLCKFSVPFREPNDICGLGNFSYIIPDGKGNLLSLAPKCVHMITKHPGCIPCVAYKEKLG